MNFRIGKTACMTRMTRRSLLFNKPGYDPGQDFAPIGLVAHFQFVLAVPAAHPARNVPQLLG